MLCIRYIPDDGLSGQPKHVAVCNKRPIYQIPLVVYCRL